MLTQLEQHRRLARDELLSSSLGQLGVTAHGASPRTMPVDGFDLGPVLEHAMSELGDGFQLHNEREVTVLVPTAQLPPAYLDALGIPEAEPVHLLWRFSGSW